MLFGQLAGCGQPRVRFRNDIGNWRSLPFQHVDAVLPALDRLGPLPIALAMALAGLWPRRRPVPRP